MRWTGCTCSSRVCRHTRCETCSAVWRDANSPLNAPCLLRFYTTGGGSACWAFGAGGRACGLPSGCGAYGVRRTLRAVACLYCAAFRALFLHLVPAGRPSPAYPTPSGLRLLQRAFVRRTGVGVRYCHRLRGTALLRRHSLPHPYTLPKLLVHQPAGASLSGLGFHALAEEDLPAHTAHRVKGVL